MYLFVPPLLIACCGYLSGDNSTNNDAKSTSSSKSSFLRDQNQIMYVSTMLNNQFRMHIKSGDRPMIDLLIYTKAMSEDSEAGNGVSIQVNNMYQGDFTSNLLNPMEDSEITMEEVNTNAPFSTLATAFDEEKPRELRWWQTSVFYQIDPRSFLDSDADGVGDLLGITSKLDYLSLLGVGGVILSPMADFAYNMSNFSQIEPMFGSMEQFEVLIEELHSRGIYLVMDFVPTYTSDEHYWFNESVYQVEPFTDYYVWRNASHLNETTDLNQHNDSIVDGFYSWEWSAERDQFYRHQFCKGKPDLNLRNPLVMDELDGVLEFWLEKGVDGFRIMEPMFAPDQDDLEDVISPGQDLTSDLSESVDSVRRWRRIVDQYTDRVLIEVYDDGLNQILKYYANSTEEVSHFPVNFDLITKFSSRSDVTGHKLKEILDIWMDLMPKGIWPNWVLGSHDHQRVSTRLGSDIAEVLNVLILLLPGTPITYYGEEIGIEDTKVMLENVMDYAGLNLSESSESNGLGSDSSRSLMQWDDSKNAGFSQAPGTWAVNSNYELVNVAIQLNSTQSPLKTYQNLTRLRKEMAFSDGNLEYIIVSDDILAFQRGNGSDTYLIVLNLGTENVPLNQSDFRSSVSKFNSVIVILRTSGDDRDETALGSVVDLKDLYLYRGQGIVLKVVENEKENEETQPPEEAPQNSLLAYFIRSLGFF